MAQRGQESFGTLLRGLREGAGLSQEELAERAGLSSHAVSALERGTRTRPYPHTIRALADALGASDADRAALIAAVPARTRATPAPGDAAPTVRSRELPRPATPMVGRDADVERVAGLVREQRLVTLTGTGGVGKTRLALAVAEQVRDRFSDGVACVELAPLLDPAAVLPAIADAVDATLTPDADPVGVVADRVRDQQVLLVLDNVEHVLDAAPQVAALVAAAPGLTVLATSRAPLRLRGEVEVAVEPLGLPDGAGDSPAVRLLLARAAAMSAGWGTDPTDAGAARAHATHYLSLAEEVAPRYRDGGQVEALVRIDDEHPNLTAAIERSLAAGEAATAGRFCWALWLYWWLRGHHAHGRRLSEAVLQHDLPGEVRPRAALAAATMTFALDDVPAARRWWHEAQAHAADDPTTMANAVAGVGLSALAVGDLAEAADCFLRARSFAEAGGTDGEWTWALSWIWHGTVALLEGDFDRAVEDIERGLASVRRRGDRLSAYIALYNLSQVELARGGHDASRRHLEEGMRLSLETGDHANLAYLLDATAVLEMAEGTHARVPLLLGAAQGIREAIGSRGYGYYRPDPAQRAAAADEARARLGPDRYDDALDVGRGLPPEEAAALALGERSVTG